MEPLVAECDTTSGDSIEQLLKTSTCEQLQELLCGGWILNHYLMKPCPPNVAEWLFDIMCQHEDIHVVSCAYQALWAFLLAGSEVRNLSHRDIGS